MGWIAQNINIQHVTGKKKRQADFELTLLKHVLVTSVKCEVNRANHN